MPEVGATSYGKEAGLAAQASRPDWETFGGGRSGKDRYLVPHVMAYMDN